MKHRYVLVSVSSDGKIERLPMVSLKSAKAFKESLEAVSLPGWTRFIAIEEVEK